MEDDLSEWILRRILQERPAEYIAGQPFKKGGFGYLKKQARAFNNVARIAPVLLLTDLDHHDCAPEMLRDWLDVPRHQNFLIRVAVREVEAWLLASDDELAAFLGLRCACSFPHPENLPDPKRILLSFAARSSRREFREGLVHVSSDGVLRQGPAYNSLLAGFVATFWDVDRSAKKCPSLHRLLASLARLETRCIPPRQPG